jgi:hypothetical protein
MGLIPYNNNNGKLATVASSFSTFRRRWPWSIDAVRRKRFRQPAAQLFLLAAGHSHPLTSGRRIVLRGGNTSRWNDPLR